MNKLILSLYTLIFILSFALLESKSIEIVTIDKKTNLEIIPDYIRIENSYLGLDTTFKSNGQAKVNFDFGQYTSVIDDNTINSNSLISNINPNPVSIYASFDVNLNEETNLCLELFDLLGNKLVLLKQFFNSGNHRFILNTQSLKSGVYFIKANIGNNSQTNKLIVNSNNVDNTSKLQFEHISSSANLKSNEIQSSNNYTFTCYKLYYASKKIVLNNDSLQDSLAFKLDSVKSPFKSVIVTLNMDSIQLYNTYTTYFGGSQQTSSSYETKNYSYKYQFGNFYYLGGYCDTNSFQNTINIISCGYFLPFSKYKILIDFNSGFSKFNNIAFSYEDDHETDIHAKRSGNFLINEISKVSFQKGNYIAKIEYNELKSNLKGFRIFEDGTSNVNVGIPPKFTKESKGVLGYPITSYIKIELVPW